MDSLFADISNRSEIRISSFIIQTPLCGRASHGAILEAIGWKGSRVEKTAGKSVFIFLLIVYEKGKGW